MQLKFQGRFQIKEFPTFNSNRRISDILELQSFVVEFEIFVCASARMVFGVFATFLTFLVGRSSETNFDLKKHKLKRFKR